MAAVSFTAQVESYRLCLPELKACYPAHWDELALLKDKRKLDPNYLAYEELDRLGCVLLVTLRDERKKLAGYYIGFTFPELHYKTWISNFADIFRVNPEYRGQWAGVKLFRAVEQELRARGVMLWHVTTKLHSESGAVLRRCGMTPDELHYSKALV